MSSALFPFMAAGSPAKTELPLFREYVYTSADGVQLVSGNTRIVEGLPALEIWIRKALTTPRYRCAAYSWSFGSELHTLVGADYTPALVRVEAERMVREALMISPYIRSVGTVTTAMDGDTLHIRCHIDTVYGEVSVDV